MPMTVLTAPLVVGIDGSAEHSRDAVTLAGRLADPDQLLLLTHVHPYGALSSPLGAQYEALLGRSPSRRWQRRRRRSTPPANTRRGWWPTGRQPPACTSSRPR
jgi:hypothetical protein